MSFYKIPQNYAPGFVPQHYVFINDAAATTLTARLSDARSGDAVASLALHNLWMPDIEVSAFLKRMAAAAPFEGEPTGLYAPSSRTIALSVSIGNETAPERIFLPATQATQAGEVLTSLPPMRLIAPDESDEVSINCQTPCSALLTVNLNGGRAEYAYSIAGQGVVLFRLDAGEFPGAESFDLTVTAAGADTILHYEVAEAPVGGRRLAWLNAAGGIDRYTFPLVEECRYEIERRRLRLETSGYTQSEAVAEQRLSLGSAYEPAAVLDALAQLAAAPAVGAATNGGWTEVDVVSDTLRIERLGRLQHLTLQIRPRQRGGRL